ncbi:CIC11C00000003575 [Sungouiella intermedia]|uniref:CIC11C00000003575 n=1 Tax=Sungouiella intermedia TaxID=45354 RepID=A0A1L0C0T3_9ASCO|nr:CIC11C00000003575 [[Candida] intermedia]
MELEEEVIQEKIDLATHHFRSKNFSKCLELFNEITASFLSLDRHELKAIRKHYALPSDPIPGEKLVHPQLATVLDLRAATYEKLGEFQKAMKDAHTIISIKPSDCRGYLRKGKLLLRETNTREAYQCFQQGRYYVKRAKEQLSVEVSDRLLAKLEAEYQKLNAHLKIEREREKGSSLKQTKERSLKLSTVLSVKHPASKLSLSAAKSKSFPSALQMKLDEMLPLKRSKSSSLMEVKKPKVQKFSPQDPFRVLPGDVIQHIFSLLPPNTLLRCHKVCRYWYQSLTSLPDLYKHIFTLKHGITPSEYFQGLKLVKRVLQIRYSRSVHAIRLGSTTNLPNLNKILESIITDKTLRLNRLEIINKLVCFEYLLKVLDKCNWNYEALQTIEYLRLGLNSSIPSYRVFLKLFPQLRSLDIIIIDQKFRETNKFFLPLDLTNMNMFLKESEILESNDILESLSLVNHTALTKDFQSRGPGDRTYYTKPRFLAIKMTNLRKLTAVNFDFSNLEIDLGRFLSFNLQLKDLYLENNTNLSLKDFLTVLRLYEPEFHLDRLTMREKQPQPSYGMAEMDVEGIRCLHSLKHLDIYGSSLSCRGLLKMLSIANHQFQLQSLNIGNSCYIYLKRDSFVRGREVLNFGQVFELVPGLQNLYLNELDLDNVSMKFLHNDLVKVTGYAECPLKVLDLSFCHQIDGIGLMNLVNASYSQPSEESTLQFDELILDGLSINKLTLALLSKRELVTKVTCDPLKPKWRQYGINSFVQDVVQNPR